MALNYQVSADYQTVYFKSSVLNVGEVQNLADVNTVVHFAYLSTPSVYFNNSFIISTFSNEKYKKN